MHPVRAEEVPQQNPTVVESDGVVTFPFKVTALAEILDAATVVGVGVVGTAPILKRIMFPYTEPSLLLT